MGIFWSVKTRDQAKAFADYVLKEQEEGRDHYFQLLDDRRDITVRQIGSLHAMYRRLAQRLNEAGFEVTHPLNSKITIPWTEVSVKELLFAPVMKSMFGKKSHAKLTSKEVNEMVDVTLARIAEITGVVEGFTREESNLLNGGD